MGRDELLRLLAAEGVPADPAWRAAFRAVPREWFVPEYFVPGPGGYERRARTDPDPAARRRWLDGVHEDVPLATRLHGGEPVSSSSQPSLMATMLDELHVGDGMSVLEVGTGTGWNAALLAHRLGADRVTTVDVEPELTEAARDRLRAAGHPVTVVTGDGALGWPGRAPYDRIIATCALYSVPPAWLEQCAPGALILMPLATGLLRLRVGAGPSGPQAEGRFLDTPAFFVPLRGGGDGPGPGPGGDDPGVPGDDVPGHALYTDSFRFLLALSAGSLPGRTAYALWERAGRPDRPRYGVTADLVEQWAWLDDPHGPDRWRLPGAPAPGSGGG